jgi:hypothetical protein
VAASLSAAAAAAPTATKASQPLTYHRGAHTGPSPATSPHLSVTRYHEPQTLPGTPPYPLPAPVC